MQMMTRQESPKVNSSHTSHENKRSITQKQSPTPTRSWFSPTLMKNTRTEHPAKKDGIIQRQSITAIPGTYLNTQPPANIQQVQAYANANTPEILALSVPQPVPFIYNAGRRAKDISEKISPITATIGTDVSNILRSGTPWRAGNATAGTLNEFNLVYRVPWLRFWAEQEFNPTGNSYIRHSFITNPPAGVGADITHEYTTRAAHARKTANPTAYSTGAQARPGLPAATIHNNTANQFQDQHGGLGGRKIKDALNLSANGDAADALSMVMAESARFGFLRKSMSELTTNTWIIIGLYAIKSGNLFSNFNNIVRNRHRAVIAPGGANIRGWETYNLTASDVFDWIRSQHSLQNPPTNALDPAIAADRIQLNATSVILAGQAKVISTDYKEFSR